jgi:hypothetical protein
LSLKIACSYLTPWTVAGKAEFSGRHSESSSITEEETKMEERKCPTLVDGKECGLDLLLVERELDTQVEIYECVRGHRTEQLFSEVVKRTCTSFVDGKECGLPLALVQRELETATEVYECPLDHRTYVALESEALDE